MIKSLREKQSHPKKTGVQYSLVAICLVTNCSDNTEISHCSLEVQFCRQKEFFE